MPSASRNLSTHLVEEKSKKELQQISQAHADVTRCPLSTNTFRGPQPGNWGLGESSLGRSSAKPGFPPIPKDMPQRRGARSVGHCRGNLRTRFAQGTWPGPPPSSFHSNTQKTRSLGPRGKGCWRVCAHTGRARWGGYVSARTRKEGTRSPVGFPGQRGLVALSHTWQTVVSKCSMDPNQQAQHPPKSPS